MGYAAKLGGSSKKVEFINTYYTQSVSNRWTVAPPVPSGKELIAMGCWVNVIDLVGYWQYPSGGWRTAGYGITLLSKSRNSWYCGRDNASGTMTVYYMYLK